MTHSILTKKQSLFCSYDTFFRIRSNRRRNHTSIEKVKTYGICCWKICSRRGCETLAPGLERVPSYNYFHKAKMIHC